MLGLTLADIYNLSPPKHIQDDSVVGHPKTPPLYPQIPQIIHSHSIPHFLLKSRLILSTFHFPKYLILIRDVRHTLVSYYEKWNHVYGVDFSTFVRGDVRGKKFRKDVWFYIQFLNDWGALVAHHPERIAVLKYEEIRADPVGELARVLDYFGIAGATPQLLKSVVAKASKSEMANRPNPRVKASVVRMDDRSSAEWFSEEDRLFISQICRRNLKYTFGYQYG